MDAVRGGVGATGRGAARTAPLRDLQLLYTRLSPDRRRHLWLVVALTLLGGLAELCTIGALVPFLTLLATDRAVGSAPMGWFFELLNPTAGQAELVAASVLFSIFAVATAAVRFGLAWATQSFVERVGHELSTEIQRRLLLQPYSYHLVHGSSEAVAALEQVGNLTSGLIQQVIQATAAAIIAAFIVAAIAFIDLRTALFATTAAVVAYVAIGTLLRSRLKERSTVIAETYEQRVRCVQESLGGIRDVILDDAASVHLETFRTVDAQLTQARTAVTVASFAPRFVIEAGGIVALAVVALALSSRMGLATALPIIGALALAAQRLLPLVNQMYQGWAIAAANAGLAGQVARLLSLPLSYREGRSEPLPFRSKIELRDVSFRYPERNREAVSGITMILNRGERVAITGRTGAGKSTLADLVMGLLFPDSGSITVDGFELDRQSRWQWHASVAHVPQSIFLIDDSIARNIALSAPHQPVDRARMRKAAAFAQLDEFVDTLAHGFDTVVGERGVRLSGGQRQRIGIARALYKQAPLLVLDEATSALDEATERLVLQELRKVPHLTVLIIAHRHSTVEQCDRHLRLKEGRLETD